MRLTSAPNFRDLGGIVVGDRRVRSGCIYRSGVLDRATADDLGQIAALGIRTVVDVRGPDERAARPCELTGATTIALPVTDVSASPQTIVERLERGELDGVGATMLIRGNEAFVHRYLDRCAEAVRVLVDPDRWPAMVHCTAGKDRTGFLVACVLWTLGADDETVMADYLHTNERLAPHHDKVLADAANRLADLEPLRAMLEVRAEYLDAARRAIDERFTSIDAFVRDGLGIDDAMRDRARAGLLEPAQ